MNCLICNRSIDKFDPIYNGCPDACPFNEQPQQLIEDPAANETEVVSDAGPIEDSEPPAPPTIDGGGVTL